MKLSYFILLILFLLIYHISYSQETCTVLTSGKWTGDATWSCTGSATVPEDANVSTIVIPDGKTLTIKTNVKWYSNVIVENGGTIVFDNQLSLGEDPDCGYTFIIESGGKITDSGQGANDRLYICGVTIISSAPNPPATAVDWPDGGIVGPQEIDDTGGTLPVELISFEAKAGSESIILSWFTASEINNDYFTLEKSKNGKDFAGLGTVSGNGTTNILSDYSFADNSPYLGLSYYRLSQTDYDGAYEVFPVISVVYKNRNSEFSIGPNPITNQSIRFKVSGKTKNELLKLNIIDLQGKLVETQQFRADMFGNVDTEVQLRKQPSKRTYIFELVSKNHKEYLKVASD